MTKLQRKSDSAGQEMHTTLNEIIKKIKEILKNIKKERDQFLAIKQTYNRNDFNINNHLFEIGSSRDEPPLWPWCITAMGNRHENICSLIITESVNIDGILAQQRLAWTALEQKRAELQIALSSK